MLSFVFPLLTWLISFQIMPFSEEDKKAKLQLCSKYLEMFTQLKERESSFVDLSIDLLVGMRDTLQTNQAVCVGHWFISLLYLLQCLQMHFHIWLKGCFWCFTASVLSDSISGWGVLFACCIITEQQPWWGKWGEIGFECTPNAYLFACK